MNKQCQLPLEPHDFALLQSYYLNATTARIDPCRITGHGHDEGIPCEGYFFCFTRILNLRAAQSLAKRAGFDTLVFIDVNSIEHPYLLWVDGDIGEIRRKGLMQ